MRSRLLHIPVLILLCVLALTACVDGDGFDKALVSRVTEPCLIVRGKTVLTYDAATCQEAYRPVQRTYRLGTDTMSDYFRVTMSAVPSAEGQKITASLSWTRRDNEQVLDRQAFVVEDVGRDGLVWLWCSRQRIAIALRIPEP